MWVYGPPPKSKLKLSACAMTAVVSRMVWKGCSGFTACPESRRSNNTYIQQQRSPVNIDFLISMAGKEIHP